MPQSSPETSSTKCVSSSTVRVVLDNTLVLAFARVGTLSKTIFLFEIFLQAQRKGCHFPLFNSLSLKLLSSILCTEQVVDFYPTFIKKSRINSQNRNLNKRTR